MRHLKSHLNDALRFLKQNEVFAPPNGSGPQFVPQRGQVTAAPVNHTRLLSAMLPALPMGETRSDCHFGRFSPYRLP